MRQTVLPLCLLLLLILGAKADPTRDMESQIVALTNQSRAQQGLPVLEEMPALARAATGHSEEMAKLNYFDHSSPTAGLTEPWDRVERAGGPSDLVAENIFKTTGAPIPAIPRECMTAWMKSSDHRANILDKGVRYVGVGVAIKGKTIWVTQVFCGPASNL